MYHAQRPGAVAVGSGLLAASLCSGAGCSDGQGGLCQFAPHGCGLVAALVLLTAECKMQMPAQMPYCLWLVLLVVVALLVVATMPPSNEVPKWALVPGRADKQGVQTAWRKLQSLCEME